jgi:hypothetical protein
LKNLQKLLKKIDAWDFHHLLPHRKIERKKRKNKPLHLIPSKI